MEDSSAPTPPATRLTPDTLIALFDARMAVADHRGMLTAANEAWRRFARGDAEAWPRACLGESCLSDADKASARGVPGAAAFSNGMRELLAGRRETVEVDYVCSRRQVRVRCRARRFSVDGRSSAFIVHEECEPDRGRDRDLEGLTESLPVGAFLLDARGRVLESNRYLQEFLGYDDRSMSDLEWSRAVHSDDAQKLRRAWSRLRRDGQRIHLEVRCPRPDGAQRTAVVRMAPLQAANPAVAAVGTIVDTTDRARMEECLRTVSVELTRLQGDELFATAARRIAAILEVDTAFIAVPAGAGRARTVALVVDGEVRPNFEYELAGTPCNEVIGGHTLVFPSGLQRRFPEDSVAVDLEAEAYAGVALTGSGGEPIGVLAITSRRSLPGVESLPALMHLFAGRLVAALEREESTARFRELFEFLPDAMQMCDENGRIVLANRATTAMFGYDAAGLRGQPITTLVPGVSRVADAQQHEGPLGAPRARPAGSAAPLSGLREDGSTFPVEVSIAPFQNAHGRFLLSAMRDITPRIEIETARMRRERGAHLRIAIEDAFANLSRVSDILPHVARMLRRNLEVRSVEIRLVGDALPAMHAFSSADGPAAGPSPVPGRSSLLAVAPVARVWLRDEFERAAVHEGCAWRPAALPADIAGCPLTLEEQAIGTIVVESNERIARDCLDNLATAASVISANLGRRVAEDALMELAAQLEKRVATRTAELVAANGALDDFAAGVSHDLRAPIRRIGGFLALLEEKVEGLLDEEGRHALEQLRRTNREMSEILGGMLEVARTNRAELRSRTVDLSALVAEAIARSAPADARRIEFLASPLPRVLGDPALLRQVLDNLLSNAVKYTRPRELARIEVGHDGVRDGLVSIYVRDNGVGFDPAAADRLFRMFQRLHGADAFEGTGVGLATVKRIVERHGGTVRAEATRDGGATFRFTLPVAVN